MNILVTGGSGMLGMAVSLKLKDLGEVTSTYNSNRIKTKGCKSVFMDILDNKSTVQTVKKSNPDFIIHTAALVGVGICEKEKELAYNVNVNGTKNIADAAKNCAAALVYISTDYIFDGKKGNYSENDTPNPINNYGLTKLKGEDFADSPKDLVIRTSIYGHNLAKGRSGFLNWLTEELRSGKVVNAFTDQVSSMMLVNDFADAISKLMEKKNHGIFNIASGGKASKYSFSVEVANSLGLDSSLISGIKNSEMGGFEKRPLDTSLDTRKAREAGIVLPSISEGIKNLAQLGKSRYADNFKVM